eukprot:gene28240-34099_t
MTSRPQSAYKKGKTDQKDLAALFEDYEAILSSAIDEKYIQSQLGDVDLQTVEYISLQIDSATQSIFELPELLPQLKHLVLDNSNVSSVRDLGVGLRSLWSLSLCGCALYDIDGIGVLTGLKELNVSNNFISDVTPLALHENLQTLNLTGNKICDLSFGDALASCPALRSLFMARTPLTALTQYRHVVPYLIPSLSFLDGQPVD